MRRALLLCSTLVLAARVVQADGPSFDCAQAKAPIEQIICDDAELMRLDGLLGTSYTARLADSADAAALKAEQRAWLGSRLERCSVPTKGTPTLSQRWHATPCLVERYAERITALGGDPAVVPPSALMEEPSFIHPICLEAALGSDLAENTPRPAPVPLADCNRGNRYQPATITETGYLTSTDANDGYATSFSYRMVGQLADGRRLAITSYWGGGSGSFSNVAALSGLKAGALTAEVVDPGGDRCFGGIEAATIVGGDAVDVDSNVTLSDLVSNAPNELARQLSGCAICCVGTVRYRVVLDGSKSSAMISLTINAIPAGENAAQKCASALMEKAAPSLPATLDVAKAKKLAADIVASCSEAK